jgi:tripartite-type tricarboxylate transporter receptor subunit TctC
MVVRLVMAALIGLLALGAGGANAQQYPDKPIKIVVGFAAGGIADLGARLLADHISRATGQQAVVENRTGAAGSTGLASVAKADPDGYTLGFVLSGQLVINPFVQKQMAFDVQKDLVPVAWAGEAPQMVGMSTTVPAKSAKEFIALAKANPGKYSYGSAGPGSSPHLSADTFARMAGIKLVHVPYRGNAPAITDLMAGRVQIVSSSIGSFRAGIQAGKIRVLLTATKKRLPELPDVPTAAEAGVPGYVMSVWLGVVAPAGTPAPVVTRIHALVDGMLKDDTAKKRLASAGLDVTPMSQAAFAGFVKTEYVRWEKIVKDAGVEKR